MLGNAEWQKRAASATRPTGHRSTLPQRSNRTWWLPTGGAAGQQRTEMPCALAPLAPFEYSLPVRKERGLS